jgi:membrane-bound lytic murein transglycosylase D
MHRNLNFLVIVIVGFFIQTAICRGSDQQLPRFAEIEKNVEFWTLIYSTHTSRQLVFHDASELMRIYGVVNLPKGVRPFTRRAERISRTEKGKVKALLLRFSRGEKPKNLDEQIIFNYFPPNSTSSTFVRASRNLRTQVGQADRFRQGVIRSGLYLPYIQKVFEEYDLPKKLAYLPHVESSFDYRAYSKFGAAGIWQFIRSTGRRFMRVGYTIDERRDPVRATVAAAKLLRNNYEQIKNWPLAITAYNHGLAGMRRAARRVGTKDFGKIYTSYDGRRFGFASKNFYASFLAAVEVAGNYKKYFGDLKIMQPIKYQSVTIKKSIDLPTLVKHLQVDEEKFKFLNLGFRPAAYRYGKSIPRNYVVRLPIEDGKDFLALLETLPDKTKVKPGSDLGWVQVQRGDTLWELSRQLGVPMRELRAINDLSSTRLLVGQILKVPGKSVKGQKRTPVKVASKIPKTQKASIKQTASLATVSPARQDSALRLDREWQSMIEKSRQQQASIAQGAWQGPHAPRDWHGSLAVVDISKRGGGQTGYIIIEPEETLGHLAEWLDVSAQTIRNLNNFSYKRALGISEKVQIPLGGVSKEEFEERRMRYHLGLQEDFYANYRIETVKDYTIKRGDSIWQLVNETLEVPVWLLREYNPDSNLTALQVGEKLTYPVVEPRDS